MIFKKRVGLLFGGRSGAHELSIRSAQSIFQALHSNSYIEIYEILPFYIDKNGQWQPPYIAKSVLDSGIPLQCHSSSTFKVDLWKFPSETAEVEVWFPTVCCGPGSNDGSIQGLFQLMRVPFVGSSVLGAALGADKIAMKNAFAQAGLPQVSYQPVNRNQVCDNFESLAKLCDEIEATFKYPCFVKPARLGSSIGISKVYNQEQLQIALKKAAHYDRRIIVEQGISARELSCGVLGNDSPKLSVVSEVIYQKDFLDYEAKYTKGQTNRVIPNDLPQEIVEKIHKMALNAFSVVNAAGMARIDFFYVESNSNVLINEINTIMGLTPKSAYPKIWAQTGIDFPNLIDQIIRLALEQ